MTTPLEVLLAALATAVATGLGALPFVFTASVSPRAVAWADAIASGLMLGASFSLVAEGTALSTTGTLGGAALGVAFIVLTERVLWKYDVPLAGLRGAGARRMLLILAVMTAHSFAEGVAVGVSFGGGATLAAAITIAIAVHNIPEGLAISAVLRPQGIGLIACAGWSVLSSLPQPIMAVPAWLFVERVRPVLPWGLGFAAGAMVYMVLKELLPEAYEQAPARHVALLVSLSMVAMVLLQRYL